MKLITTVLLAFYCLSPCAESVLYENTQFRLYTFAENQNMQSKISDNIQQAYDAFEYYFDVPAQAMTVVAFPNIAMMQSFDLGSLEIRGKLLPFFVEAEPVDFEQEPTSVQPSRLFADLGLKVKQSHSSLLVDEVLQQIVMLNGLSELQIDDQLQSIDGIVLTELDELTGVINKLQSGDTFSVKIVRNNVTKQLVGKKLNLTAQVKKSDETSKKKDADVMLGALQHEIGHYLLMSHMGDEPKTKNANTNNKQQAYGSLKTPDWLDELVANMCEGELVKSIHRESIKHVSDLMPLTELLTTRHPSMDKIMDSQAYKNKFQQGAKNQTIILSVDDFTADEWKGIKADTGTFYGSSLLFGEFLYHLGGSHLLKNIINEIKLNGDTGFSEILNLFNPLKNTIDELEQDFHRFVEIKLDTK